MIRAVKLEGSSMRPLFDEGEVVLVEDRRPAAGDCALYSYKGRRLLHRAFAVNENGLFISDDAGCLEPHLVPWTDVEGRVKSSNPLKNGFFGLLYFRLRRLAGRNKS
jgi:hypothetical protein